MLDLLEFHYNISAFLNPLLTLALLVILIVATKKCWLPKITYVISAAYFLALLKQCMDMAVYYISSSVGGGWLSFSFGYVVFDMLIDWSRFIVLLVGWILLIKEFKKNKAN